MEPSVTHMTHLRLVTITFSIDTARTWFLEIAFIREVSMCVRVYPASRLWKTIHMK